MHDAIKNSTRVSSAVQEFFFDLYSRYSFLSNQIMLSKLFKNLKRFLEVIPQYSFFPCICITELIGVIKLKRFN